MAYFSVFRHVFGGTDENHDEPQDSLCTGSEFSQALTEHKSECCGLSQLAPCPGTGMASKTMGREDIFMGHINKLKA